MKDFKKQNTFTKYFKNVFEPADIITLDISLREFYAFQDFKHCIRVYPVENGYSDADSKYLYSMRLEIYGCMSDGSELPSSDSDESCAAIALTERLECGFEGISQSECVSRGCCYDNTKGSPACFYHKG